MKTLFQSILAAGIPYATHHSDLYIPDTAEARAILAGFPLQHSNARRFFNQVEKATWIDVPFSFDPWWTPKKLEEIKQ